MAMASSIDVQGRPSLGSSETSKCHDLNLLNLTLKHFYCNGASQKKEYNTNWKVQKQECQNMGKSSKFNREHSLKVYIAPLTSDSFKLLPV